ncbi:MAG TPA: hypothetical protein VEI97_07510 [bacterium]|nr:hypothetical protein [bacterium]
MVRNYRQSDCIRCGRPNMACMGHCKVSEAALNALARFALDNGRTWKQQLRDAWTRGDDVGQELQEARNVIGPSRLHKIKIKARMKRLQEGS